MRPVGHAVALVELEAHVAGDPLLALEEERLAGLGQRVEPLALVDHVGELALDGALEVQQVAREHEVLELAGAP